MSELRRDIAKTGAGVVFVALVALAVEPLGRVASVLIVGIQEGLGL